MGESVRVMTFTPSGGQTEYLESVSRTATTWTTDPNKAIHFLSERMVPVTTVFLRFPMIEPLEEGATQSQINLRNTIMKWFEEHEYHGL